MIFLCDKMSKYQSIINLLNCIVKRHSYKIRNDNLSTSFKGLNIEKHYTTETLKIACVLIIFHFLTDCKLRSGLLGPDIK